MEISMGTNIKKPYRIREKNYTVTLTHISGDIFQVTVQTQAQEPKTGMQKKLSAVFDFACGSGSLLLNVRRRMGPHGIGKICGQEKNKIGRASCRERVSRCV